VVLVAFLAGLAFVALGTTVVVVRALGLWRQTKRTGKAVGAQLSSFERRTAQSERHLAQWERSNAELQRAIERLRSSRARLQVLLDSVEQASARVRWLRVFLPR
jgi:cell division protein FtsB